MSLANIIRKRGIANPMFLLHFNSLDYVTQAVGHVDTARVNIQNVADEQERHIDIRKDLEDVCPPRTRMWFEWKGDRQIGCLVSKLSFEKPPDDYVDWQRIGPIDEPCSHLVIADLFAEIDGAVAHLGDMRLMLNEFGQVHAHSAHATRDIANVNDKQLFQCFWTVCESIVRMNTEGVIVSPPWNEPKAVHEKPNPKKLCSIWRTIHIGSEKVAHGGRNGLALTKEAADRRECWVRATRKDYRRNGLFGRTFKLVYVPEHKRGNHQLGTVVHEFNVWQRPAEAATGAQRKPH